ncbi:hypothetical protein PISL3812_06404 [Talaromyces islandicus]|uniref:Uncharacterized protein n=1 Tax=Talaromyces islandicus TaxID=28573 RepID=A0A0U1M1F0_TALIS|nr:hypothetical protein PISL3812_06404 [Talaromyces islandicus]
MDDSTNEQPIDQENEHIVSDGELLTTFATPEIPTDVLDNAGNASHDASQLLNDNASDSTSSSRRHSANDRMLDDDLADGHLVGAKSESSRSSLSSVPDSVVVRSKADMVRNQAPPGTSDVYDSDISYNACDKPIQQKIHDRNSPFRHPSSVRAMQMYTEDEEDEYMTPSRRRGPGYQGLPSSVMRSPRSPLARRQGYHSAGGTPKKPAVKTENPLVLLHCTVLPPTVVLAPGTRLPDRKVLENVLPPRFWRRWKLLEEKIIGSGLLRDRGVLLQHPQEDYGLLEERLLESLELQRPRLEHGHFVGEDDCGVSGNESNNEDTESSLSDTSHERSCPDCGCHVGQHKGHKRWEVRFYAANGLMKEGAWTAAWKEIERIDVQVSLWLPYDVKVEIESRIQEEQTALVAENELKAAQLASIEKHLPQEEIDGLAYAPQRERDIPESRPTPYDISADRQFEPPSPNAYRKPNQEIDLHTLLINYIRIVASDPRNIITVASILVASLALLYSSQTRRNMSDAIRFGDFPAVSTQVYHASSASVLTQVSTEVPAVKIEEYVEGISEVQRVAQEVNYSEPPIYDTTSTVSSVQATETLIEQVAEPLIEGAEPQSIDHESNTVADDFEPEEHLPPKDEIPSENPSPVKQEIEAKSNTVADDFEPGENLPPKDEIPSENPSPDKQETVASIERNLHTEFEVESIVSSNHGIDVEIA